MADGVLPEGDKPTQEIEQVDPTRPRFIMMSGPYGAGKTSWAEDFFERMQSEATQHPDSREWVYIRPETIMMEMARQYNMTTSQVFHNPELRATYISRAKRELAEVLAQGKNILYDSANTREDFRHTLLDIVNQHGLDYHKTAVVLNIDIADSRARVKERNAKTRASGYQDGQYITDEDFVAHWSKYDNASPVGYEEGFDLVLHIPSKEITLKKWQNDIAEERSKKVDKPQERE